MGYYDNDPDPDSDPDSGETPRGALGVARELFGLCATLAGVVLLLAGLLAGVRVILEAWTLYNEPQRIERLATAIEQGSNLDRSFISVARESSPDQPAAAATPAGTSLRLSYFAAWFIALMLLVVIGGLAMSAVSVGGRLALGDQHVRKLGRAVANEIRRLNRTA